MNPKINTIIFDLGGVLVDWNPEYVYRKVFKNDEQKMYWFLNTVCTPAWNIEQDAGRTIEEAVKLKILEFPQYEALIRMYYNEWHHMFSGIIEKNVTLFKKLRSSSNYKLYALTNWSAETWPKALKLFPFFNDFDGIVVSGQEKTRKPYSKIYKILLSRYKINPEKTIFIDDNKENLIEARAQKMIGIHVGFQTNLAEKLELFHIYC